MVTKKRAQQGLRNIIETLEAGLPDLRGRYGFCSLGLFGSYLHGREGPDSDLDILVEFEEGQTPSLLTFIALEGDLARLAGVKVDLVEKRGLKRYIGRRVLAEVVWLPTHGVIPAPEGGYEMAREYLDFLEDIVRAMEQVIRFTEGLTFEQMADDERTVLALTKAIENIGEATKCLPSEVRERYSNVPWHDMAAMRDRLAHGYFEADLGVLWQVSRERIPPLAPEMRRILDAELQARGENTEG